MRAAASAGARRAPASGDKGTVKIDDQPVGRAEANVAVVKCLLQRSSATRSKTTTLAEEVAWQGFETGEVDVILENWGHPDLEKTYITDKKVAQDAGPNGVTGIIGWYVPDWMVDEYPDIIDWNNLNKYADLFKTSESGDKGQFLGERPDLRHNDEALITNLGSTTRPSTPAARPRRSPRSSRRRNRRSRCIGYFYDPQWLQSEIKLVQVKLPPYTAGCDADLKKVACDYPPVHPQQDRRHQVRRDRR